MSNAPEPAVVEAYPSRVGEAASKKFEAMSYLPPMTADEIRAQINWVMQNDWDCIIEHVEPARASEGYWYMWKLPLFGIRDVDAVLREADNCGAENPSHHVRISGIDKIKQTMGFSLVTRRA